MSVSYQNSLYGVNISGFRFFILHSGLATISRSTALLSTKALDSQKVISRQWPLSNQKLSGHIETFSDLDTVHI